MLTILSTLVVTIGTAPAASAETITSTGPLTQITITPDLNCDVRHEADSQPEFYEETACATLLALGGTLYGPANIPAGNSASPRTPWTAVSQTRSGSGTQADPHRIVTVVDAGTTGVRLTQTDSYVVGLESYNTDVRITNNSAGAITAVLYKAGDCYLQNSDNGFGSYDPDSGAISCVASTTNSEGQQVPGSRIEQFYPLTAGSNYLEDNFNEVWAAVGSQQPFPDQCEECANLVDNGMGLSWNVALAAGASQTFSHFTTFSPLGVRPLQTAKTADRGTSPPGGTNGYTITISNPNASAITVDSIFDRLPAGFTYTAGSSTGVTTADPTIDGSTLTWRGSFNVPAGGSISLHFAVRVPTTLGRYQNEAGGTSPTVAVAPTGPTADITVARPQAVLVINDVSVVEGHTGTTPATFTVTRSGDTSIVATVNYTTAAGSATASTDYTTTTGTLTFQSGQTTRQITVPVVGDRAVEPDETFFVNLSAPSADTTISDNRGVGTIRNDDSAPVPPPVPQRDTDGYRLVATDGGVFTFGLRNFRGSLGDAQLTNPIVGGATDTSTYDGYWLVATDGEVFAFNTKHFGSPDPNTLDSPIVEIEATPEGDGYWVVTAAGTIYPFGAAKYFGDIAQSGLNAPIVGMATTSTGNGYWLIAGDGGVFNFGDARFFGSTGDRVLNAPVIDIGPTVDDGGYYVVATDGGVFTFGNAVFHGSMADTRLNAPVVSVLVTEGGKGYWLGATDGGVFTFGRSPFMGSMGNVVLNGPMLDFIF